MIPFAITCSEDWLVGGWYPPIIPKGMNSVFAFALLSAVVLINPEGLHGVQILSPWITELLKQKHEGGGEAGKFTFSATLNIREHSV